MVRRIFVEKKTGFDVESQKLFKDLKENLHLQGIVSVRVVNRYDVDEIEEATYQSAKHTVFSEPAVDLVTEESMDAGTGCFSFGVEHHLQNEKQGCAEGGTPRSPGGCSDCAAVAEGGEEPHSGVAETPFSFAVEYLPGQYDQRADSAAQCIRMIDPAAQAIVRFARVYIIEGTLTAQEQEKIKNYCINPVDSREAQLEKPETLEMKMDVPEAVAVVTEFISWNKAEVECYRAEMGFAMSAEDLLFVQKYFQEEDRDPTITELRVIDTYWSDHCRHTTFMTEITDVDFGDGPYGSLVKVAYEDYLKLRQDVYGERTKEKEVCLMDMAVIGTKYLKSQGFCQEIDESEEINACSIKVKAKIDGREEDWLVMFKNETHNHPTEIEPFGGAATCLGGAIRDPLSGRVYVYQAMRVTGSADPRKSIEETIPGKLPQRLITKGAAQGYSSYGNQIGLATGQVHEIYDEDYAAKRMEIGAVIGAAPASHVIRKRPEPGDLIVLVGGRTGRDGCGGATGSSKEHTEDSINTCGAEVQKGNPPVERNIQRFYRRQEVTTLIKRCNDFGAGGVSVAIGELADSIDVNLDLVPKKYDGLDGTELAISESQERMAAVVAKEDAEAFIRYAKEENLEATIVASVTDTGYFRMFWREDCILRLSRTFLDTNGVKQQTKAFIPADSGLNAQAKQDAGSAPVQAELSEEALLQLVSGLDCCSQKGLIENFDSTIGAATVLMPLGGKHQLTPAMGMAAKLPVRNGETDTATLMTFGYDPELAKKSTYHSALYAVVDSTTKLTAMGGDYSKAYLTFQEYFERLGKEPEKWGRPLGALLGGLKAQLELGIAAIGGKDSMSGTFMDITVPPTLVSFAVTACDAADVISPEFKEAGSTLVYVCAGRDENDIIDFAAYKRNMAAVTKLIQEKKILSASNVARGGVFAAVVKMAAGNMIGANLIGLTNAEILQPQYGNLILEFPAGADAAALLDGVQHKKIGITKAVKEVAVTADGQTVAIGLDKLVAEWQKPLENVFPSVADMTAEEAAVKPPVVECKERNTAKPAVSIVRPKVFIPAFPGTNCEVDSARAFERAGAEALIQVVCNQNEQDLIDSIKAMEKHIRNSQIIMIPGGFSGGDEPDGSAKFITALFRNERIQDALSDLLENRDGLMLGICNGFQALVKLGLLPYGKITEMKDDSPTLTYNKIGRHVSCLAGTRVASVRSPWLANVEVGDVHTIAISHGEGRFIASEKLVEELAEKGQIATQYVDLAGQPTMDPRYNPNGSVAAICGITSPDGRIFGKMGHSERIGKNVYKNVPGSKDQKLFEAGVAYFTR